MNERVVQAAFAFWRLTMWMDGYGSYTDIEWAVSHGVLRPFHHPRQTARLRKWIIRRFGPSSSKNRE